MRYVRDPLPTVPLAEYLEALKNAPVRQRLTLPLPPVTDGDLVYGLMVNELITPWGAVLAAFPVRWTEHRFDDPEVLEPVEFTTESRLAVTPQPVNDYAVKQVLYSTALYRAEILPGFDDTRTPGFIGRRAHPEDQEALLVFEKNEKPVRDLAWVPPALRAKCRLTKMGICCPVEDLSAADVYCA